jgi:hypothetical protein
VGLKKLPFDGGLCHHIADFDHKGLINLPLIRRLCLIKPTLTTVGLKELPLVGGLHLEWTLIVQRIEMTSQEDKAKSKASNQQVNHDVQDLPESWKILH